MLQKALTAAGGSESAALIFSSVLEQKKNSRAEVDPELPVKISVDNETEPRSEKIDEVVEILEQEGEKEELEPLGEEKEKEFCFSSTEGKSSTQQ
jgi:hypothetical protein